MIHQPFIDVKSIKSQSFINTKKHLPFVYVIPIKSNQNVNAVNTESTKHQHFFNIKRMPMKHLSSIDAPSLPQLELQVKG